MHFNHPKEQKLNFISYSKYIKNNKVKEIQQLQKINLNK